MLIILSNHFSSNLDTNENIKNVIKITNNELVEQVSNMNKQGVLFSNDIVS